MASPSHSKPNIGRKMRCEHILENGSYKTGQLYIAYISAQMLMCKAMSVTRLQYFCKSVNIEHDLALKLHFTLTAWINLHLHVRNTILQQ